jgi:hypothetical protein
MARIKIEDLPVVENLTPEEEELIFGAGRRSFRPMLESLENREMMDAGLGFALQAPLAQSTGGAPQLALVRQLAIETTQQVNHFIGSAIQTAQTAHAALQQAAIDQLFAGFGRQNLPQSLGQAPEQSPPQNLLQNLPRGQGAQGTGIKTTQQDAEFVREQASKLVQQKVCKQQNYDVDANVKSSRIVSTSENEIRIEFKIDYHNEWFGYGKTEGTVALSFKPTWQGDVKVYKIHSASHNNMNDGIRISLPKVEKGLNDLCANERIVTSDKFDSQKFAQGVAQQASGIGVSFGHPHGQLSVRGVRAIDGGIQVEVSQRRDGTYHDGYVLEFKYETRDIQAGSFKLASVQKGCWDSSSKFHGLPLAGGEEAALKAARWDVTPILYNAQDIGKNFGDQVRSFLERGGTGSQGSQIVAGSAEIKGIVRTAQGLRVVVEAHRTLQLNDDPGVKTGVHTRFAFDLKYEGRGQDGMDRFSVVSVTHVPEFVYGAGNRDVWQTGDHYQSRGLHYGLEVFGTSCDSLQKNFPGFSFKATA